MGILRRLIGAVVGLVLVLGIGLAWNKFQEKKDTDDAKADAPKVGACLIMSGSTFRATHEEVDCGAADAAYRVTADDGSCDETAEINYTISLGAGKSGNVADLCLAWNAAEGDCMDPARATTSAKKVDCSEASPGSRILKVVSVGKAGEKCVNGTQPLENVKRDTLLCLGSAA